MRANFVNYNTCLPVCLITDISVSLHKILPISALVITTVKQKTHKSALRGRYDTGRVPCHSRRALQNRAITLWRHFSIALAQKKITVLTRHHSGLLVPDRSTKRLCHCIFEPQHQLVTMSLERHVTAPLFPHVSA